MLMTTSPLQQMSTSVQIYKHPKPVNVDFNRVLFVLCAEGDHSEVDVPQTAHQPVPGDG